MRLEKKMKLRKRVFIGILATIMTLSSSIVAFAQDKEYKYVKDMLLEAENSISKKEAYGWTDGGSGAYRNQVSVFDFDKKGNCLGNIKKTGIAEAPASATVKKSGSYRADSYHYIVTQNGGVLGGMKLSKSLK